MKPPNEACHGTGDHPLSETEGPQGLPRVNAAIRHEVSDLFELRTRRGYLLCVGQTQDALQTIANIRTETYPVSGHVGCGSLWSFLSGAPWAVAAPRTETSFFGA